MSNIIRNFNPYNYVDNVNYRINNVNNVNNIQENVVEHVYDLNPRNIHMILSNIIPIEQEPIIIPINNVEEVEEDSEMHALELYDEDDELPDLNENNDDNDDNESAPLLEEVEPETGTVEYVERREHHFVLCEPISLQEQDNCNCPICLNVIEMRNVTITRCGHVFHASCLFDATRRRNSCPMCRRVLTA